MQVSKILPFGHIKTHRERWWNRKFRILGRSIPLTTILFFVFVVAAAAAFWIIMSVQFSGSILTVTEPTIYQVGTNDDGILDHASRDPLDDGTDPYGPWESMGTEPRLTVDIQNCTISLSGNTATVVLDNAYESGNGPSYCTIFLGLENTTGNDLELTGVELTGSPPIIAELGAGYPCGFPLGDTEFGLIMIDLHTATDAPGGAFGGATIDLKWEMPGSYSCP